MTWTNEEKGALKSLLNKVREENRWWPDDDTLQLVHQILPVPATEVAVVKEGKLLLQHRTFEEWPAPYNRPGWYIPGGYVPWDVDLQEACNRHLRKDLRGEYRRVGNTTDVDEVFLSKPVIIGVEKWMPGEHPFGCPVSLVCVCRLIAGNIAETDWLRFVDTPVPTDVPHHFSFQEMVFDHLAK